MRAISAVMVAEFHERTRRPAYLVVLLAAVALAYGAVPAPDSRWLVFHLGDYRGIYNSAWVGTVTALASAAWLSLAGFYIARGGILRDQGTGVGEILASTALSKSQYLLGKLAGYVAVLASVAAVLLLAAPVIQLLHGEATSIDVVALTVPFMLVTLPILTTTAAAAVLFDTVPLLRAGLGNLLWAIMWPIGILVMHGTGPTGMLGLGSIVESMQASITATEGQTGPVEFGVGLVHRNDPPVVFEWSGASFPAEFVISQLFMVSAAILVVLIGVSWFNRFDPARGQPRATMATAPTPSFGPAHVRSHVALPAFHAPSRLPAAATRGQMPRWPTAVRAELRVLTSGTSVWWWAGSLAIAVIGALIPLHDGSSPVLLATSIWPVIIWSRLATYSAEHEVDHLLEAYPSRGHRLGTSLVAGILVGAGISAGVAARLLLAGDVSGFATLAAGMVFAPALAQCLGVLTRSPRPFQVLYLMLWYSVLNGAPEIDVIGTLRHGGSDVGPSPLTTLTLSVALVGVAAAVMRIRHARR